jgi:DNA-binding MarR family transcriptional regulator
MEPQLSAEQGLLWAMAAAWHHLERRLDSALGSQRGVTLAEYRLLRALADAPYSRASRVELAQAVGMTPSGVTRALKPMERSGMVTTVRSKRDARFALAALSPSGRELVNAASAVVDEAMGRLLVRAPRIRTQMEEMMRQLEELA